MSQILSLYRALFRRSANIYVSKLRFAVVWLGQIHNLHTGHVYVLGLKSGSERLTAQALDYQKTQSIMHVPLQVNRFQKSILLIVQYKYLNHVPEIFILQNLILRTRSCCTGFITQSSWFFHFHLTTVPYLYQFRRGISGGPDQKYFYMIYIFFNLRVFIKE